MRRFGGHELLYVVVFYLSPLLHCEWLLFRFDQFRPGTLISPHPASATSSSKTATSKFASSPRVASSPSGKPSWGSNIGRVVGVRIARSVRELVVGWTGKRWIAVVGAIVVVLRGVILRSIPGQFICAGFIPIFVPVILVRVLESRRLVPCRIGSRCRRLVP